MGFEQVALKQNLDRASEIILQDKKHLDNNPKPVVKKDIISLLMKINNNKIFHTN